MTVAIAIIAHKLPPWIDRGLIAILLEFSVSARSTPYEKRSSVTWSLGDPMYCGDAVSSGPRSWGLAPIACLVQLFDEGGKVAANRERREKRASRCRLPAFYL